MFLGGQAVVCLSHVQQMRAFLLSTRFPPVNFTVLGGNWYAPPSTLWSVLGDGLDPCSASGASPKDDMEHGNNKAVTDAPLQMIATSYKNMLFQRFTMKAESYPCLSNRLFLSRFTFCLYRELLQLPDPVGILIFYMWHTCVVLLLLLFYLKEFCVVLSSVDYVSSGASL